MIMGNFNPNTSAYFDDHTNAVAYLKGRVVAALFPSLMGLLFGSSISNSGPPFFLINLKALFWLLVITIAPFFLLFNCWALKTRQEASFSCVKEVFLR